MASSAYSPLLSPNYFTPPTFRWQENPSGYGTAPADTQLNEWHAIMAKYPNLYSGGRSGFGPTSATAGGSTSAWGPLPATPNTQAQTGGTTAAGGLPLLQTPKSPAGNAALDAILGQTSSLSNSPDQALFTTTKDSGQGTRINTAGGNYDASTGQANQTLADFTSKFLAGDPEAKGYQQQESAAIGNWYGPASDPNSVTASLNKLTNQRRQAVQGNIMRAMDRATRQGNINRLGLGGGSSYADQQYMDTAAGIMANEAAQEADLNRTNFLTVSNAQNALAGRRSGLLNDYLSRSLIPIEAGQKLQASELGNLGSLGNVTTQNRIYQTPEQLLGSRLGLLGQYGSDLNGLNIYGVGGNFGSPVSGYPAIRGGGSPTGPLANPQGYGDPYGPLGQGPSYSTARGGGTTLNRFDPATRQAYFNLTGKYPESDPSFSQSMIDWIKANTTAPNTPNHPDMPPEYLDYAQRYGLDPNTGLPLQGDTDPSNPFVGDIPDYSGGGIV